MGVAILFFSGRKVGRQAGKLIDLLFPPASVEHRAGRDHLEGGGKL